MRKFKREESYYIYKRCRENNICYYLLRKAFEFFYDEKDCSFCELDFEDVISFLKNKDLSELRRIKGIGEIKLQKLQMLIKGEKGHEKKTYIRRKIFLDGYVINLTLSITKIKEE